MCDTFSRKIIIITLLYASFLANGIALGNDIKSVFTDEVKSDPLSHARTPLYRYEYLDREHSIAENAKNLAIVYGLTWFFYPITQPKVLRGAGGAKTYEKNFGQLVFDKDEPFWNDFVHPLSGSQLYLFYRANGYKRLSAFHMTFISSALFEFTVEILTEPASIQDLYQTPILGSALGFGIEHFSIYLLNTGNTFGMILGHLINPMTLFPFYEGKSLIIPKIDPNDKGAMIKMEFNF